jgi:hypothetical protein
VPGIGAPLQAAGGVYKKVSPQSGPFVDENPTVFVFDEPAEVADQPEVPVLILKSALLKLDLRPTCTFPVVAAFT